MLLACFKLRWTHTGELFYHDFDPINPGILEYGSAKGENVRAIVKAKKVHPDLGNTLCNDVGAEGPNGALVADGAISCQNYTTPATSDAAAQVAGLAASLWTKEPGLTASAVVNRIIENQTPFFTIDSSTGTIARDKPQSTQNLNRFAWIPICSMSKTTVINFQKTLDPTSSLIKPVIGCPYIKEATIGGFIQSSSSQAFEIKVGYNGYHLHEPVGNPLAGSDPIEDPDPSMIKAILDIEYDTNQVTITGANLIETFAVPNYPHRTIQRFEVGGSFNSDGTRTFQGSATISPNSESDIVIHVGFFPQVSNELMRQPIGFKHFTLRHPNCYTDEFPGCN